MYKLHKSEKYQQLTGIFEVPKDSENCLLTIFYPKKKEKKVRAVFGELFWFAFFNVNDKMGKL